MRHWFLLLRRSRKPFPCLEWLAEQYDSKNLGCPTMLIFKRPAALCVSLTYFHNLSFFPNIFIQSQTNTLSQNTSHLRMLKISWIAALGNASTTLGARRSAAPWSSWRPPALPPPGATWRRPWPRVGGVTWRSGNGKE